MPESRRNSFIDAFVVAPPALILILGQIAHTRAAIWIIQAIALIAMLFCIKSYQNILLKIPKALLVTTAAWIALSGVSVSWSRSPLTTLDAFLGTALGPAFLCVLAFVAATTKHGERTLAYATFFGWSLLAISVIDCVRLDATQFLMTGLPTLAPSNSPGFLYPGPGLASTYAVLCMAASLHTARVFGGRFALTMAFASALIVFATTNRAAWIAIGAFALGGCIVVFKHVSRSARTVIVAATFFCLLASILGIYTAAAVRGSPNVEKNDVFRAVERIAARDERWEIWEAWLAVAKTAPFEGFGFGKKAAAIAFDEQIKDARSHFPMAYVHAHNLPLNIYLQLGPIGTLLFALMCLAVFCAARTSTPLPLAQLGVILPLIGLLAKNITDDFYDPNVASIWWVMLGAALGSAQNLSVDSPLAREPM